MKRLNKEQLDELREFDTPTVCNALEGFKIRPNTVGFCYPGMELRTSDIKPMVGYAVTAKISGWVKPTEEQKEMMFSYFRDVREVEEPTVAVIQDIDKLPIGTFWGEVQAATFKALGAVGTLTQGGVRDLNEVDSLGFYFFSTEIMVARAEAHLVERNTSVEICGLTIRPGALIHADRHGVTIIPAEVAPRLAEACRRVASAELFVLEPCLRFIEKGEKPTVDQLRQWREQMVKLR